MIMVCLLGIILGWLFIGFGIVSYFLSSYKDEDNKRMFHILSLPLAVSGVILASVSTGYYKRLMSPMEKDVIDHKAEYIEKINIQNGDTVRIYEIKWIDKDGRTI